MDNYPRSLVRLLADSVDQFAKLLRSEIQVVRAELAEKVAQAASGAGLLAVAGILLIPVAVLLLLALASGLTELGLRPWLSQLCAGGVGLIAVAILALLRKSKVTLGNLALARTTEELSRDADAVKRTL